MCVCVLSSGAASSEQKGSSAPLSLGEQAASLRDAQERLQALRRVTSTAQILLAYSMVMRTLSQSTARSDLPLPLFSPTRLLARCVFKRLLDCVYVCVCKLTLFSLSVLCPVVSRAV